MALQRSFDGGEPARPAGREGGRHALFRRERSSVLAKGTLACPGCDAPVLPAGPVGPADALSCPFCAHGGTVRDFLSLGGAPRPARVDVRVVRRAR